MLKRNWKTFFVIISQVSDVIAILCVAAICWMLRASLHVQDVPSDHLLKGLGIFLITSLSLSSILGLYRGSFHLSLRLQNLIATRSLVLSVIISLALLTLLKDVYIDRRMIVAFVFLFPMFLFCSRWILRQFNLYFQRRGYGVHNSLIVGYDKERLNIIKRFTAFPELGYKIKGFVVKEKGEGHLVSRGGTLIERQYLVSELDQVIEDLAIDRMFIPSPDLIVNGYSSLKNLSRKHNIKLKILSPLSEDLLKYSRVYDIAGITIASPPRYRINRWKCYLKRIFDLVGASFAMVLLSPIFLLTCVAIAIENGRPLFFLQSRSSIKGEKDFFFIKFRSMVSNAEDLKEYLEAQNESDGALFKMKDDPRVTKVGRFIRKLSIDELPQLLNVLKGDKESCWSASAAAF
jgi:hypothetical protein